MSITVKRVQSIPTRLTPAETKQYCDIKCSLLGYLNADRREDVIIDHEPIVQLLSLSLGSVKSDADADLLIKNLNSVMSTHKWMKIDVTYDNARDVIWYSCS